MEEKTGDRKEIGNKKQGVFIESNREILTTVGPARFVTGPLFSGTHLVTAGDEDRKLCSEQAHPGTRGSSKEVFPSGNSPSKVCKFSKVLSLVRAFYLPFLSNFFFFFSVSVTYLAQHKSAGSGALAAMHKHYCLLQWSAPSSHTPKKDCLSHFCLSLQS